MSRQVVQQFIDALAKLESDRDVDAVAALFAKNAEVGTVVSPEVHRGLAGAREFWTQYRGTFRRVASTFRNVIVGDGHAALEWTTDGTSFDGAQIRYDGVSILELDGEKISRFRAYFDSARLGRKLTKR